MLAANEDERARHDESAVDVEDLEQEHARLVRAVQLPQRRDRRVGGAFGDGVGLALRARVDALARSPEQVAGGERCADGEDEDEYGYEDKDQDKGKDEGKGERKSKSSK